MKLRIKCILFSLSFSITSYVMSMNTQKYSSLKNSEGEFYVTDDSIPNFNKRKMLSTGSLQALSHLQDQEIIFSKEELEKRGYSIIKEKPRWRRWGGALRRYSTAIATIGTTCMVGILMYYLYSAKGEIQKAGNFINQVGPFINKAEKTFDDIHQLIKAICQEFDFPICSQFNKS